jgi:hypothetical protein
MYANFDSLIFLLSRTVFQYVMLCGLIDGYQQFGEPVSSIFRVEETLLCPEDGGSLFQ